jgi:hypothetical protein
MKRPVKLVPHRYWLQNPLYQTRHLEGQLKILLHPKTLPVIRVASCL